MALDGNRRLEPCLKPQIRDLLSDPPDNILRRGDIRSNDFVRVELGDNVVSNAADVPVNTQLLRASGLQPAYTEIFRRNEALGVFRSEGLFQLLLKACGQAVSESPGR